VPAEPVETKDPLRLVHLSELRPLIVRRSLLAAGLSGIIPVPVMDEYVASRVRAGLYLKIAAARHVDLSQASADLLSDPQDPSMARVAGGLAAMLMISKFASRLARKLFTLMAVGRGAEDMATNFQFATLVDHYCAKLHVGGAVTRPAAAQLHRMIHASIDHSEKGKLVGIFREGGRVLGSSVLEAPRWISERLNAYAQRWAASGGRGAPFDPSTDLPPEDAEGTERWLDRAARVVEERLAALGNDYVGGLVDRLEEAWKNRPPEGDKAPVQMHGNWNPFTRKAP
jgi:hypothetical protein